MRKSLRRKRERLSNIEADKIVDKVLESLEEEEKKPKKRGRKKKDE